MNKPKNKVIIIIPAYNEAKNIGKVLKELKPVASYADILVINDCSTDNTADIVKENGIPCITNVFNMRYAWAIQTGIKYACDNGYEYAIQMDADGQHLPSEAIKLLSTVKKENVDICIGSRYLKDLGYKCPFFRRIGTKFFYCLIRLITGKKITDPMSGFQCFNRRVIEYYAGCGNYPEFPDANLVIEMLLNGYRIVEVPVKMKARASGESMHSGFIKPIKYMISQFYTCVVLLIKYAGRRAKKHE